MRAFVSALVIIGTAAGAAAQTAMPPGAQSEAVGQLGAAVGATLFEIGQTSEGDTTYVAHGYADAKLKQPTTGDQVSDSSGEFAFRVKELCIKRVQAQISPVGLVGTSDTTDTFHITGVKVDTTDAQGSTCTFVVNVTYGVKLPPKAKITQIGYAVYITGSKRTPQSVPAVLPRTPL